MELIKYRGKSGGGDSPADSRTKILNPAPSGIKPENASPVRPTIPAPMSLNVLKKFSGSGNRRTESGIPADKKSHLPELRKALGDSLRERSDYGKLARRSESLAPIPRQNPPDGGEPRPAPPREGPPVSHFPSEPAAKTGVLQPGETIKFE